MGLYGPQIAVHRLETPGARHGGPATEIAQKLSQGHWTGRESGLMGCRPQYGLRCDRGSLAPHVVAMEELWV